MKVCLVGSSGGHLTHLYMLKPFWKNKDHFWVTFDKEDARSLLEGEKMYPCYYPTNRSLKALIYERFNIQRPADFTGHSLSVSDVVVLNDGNGEYVRAVESTTEQNYNMIDGCANNLPKPRIINGRESVLDKLRIRQMAREKQKSSQEQSADMERNRK